jgi:hypothetical protein
MFSRTFRKRCPALLLCLTPLWQAAADDQMQPTNWTVEPNDLVQYPVPAPAPPPVPMPVPNWAVTAMLAIDPKYSQGIVLVTGKGGTPEPKQWVVVARDSDDLGTLHKITVADGQVIADVQSMNAYESFRQDVSIDPTQVQVDSGDAFLIAEPIAAANSKIIGHVDYALTVRGKDSAPIWTLNCFDLNGGFLGKVVLLATNGYVLSQPGFKNSPSQ